MKLLTPALLDRFAAVGRQGDAADPLVIAKFFNPAGPQTWYATEYDPETRTFFGYVQLGFGPSCDEWGSFSLDELEELRIPLPIRLPDGRSHLSVVELERDAHFDPTPMSKVVPEALR
ncbi:MAG: DUF2958 domain-containing protein [Deltaproteobacteria bacterium]|nr:DUF2958 domain-containing protein [Deltaproteobacteria bacterium]